MPSVTTSMRVAGPTARSVRVRYPTVAADVLAEQRRHPPGGRTGGQPSGLEHQDPLVAEPRLAEQPQRHDRRLAGAGARRQHGDPPQVERTTEVVDDHFDRQVGHLGGTHLPTVPDRDDGTMYAVATFLIVAVLSMAFTHVAAGALIATGLPPAVASFQARSAFSGAGFTTTEAENVVNHPARRRIIGTTMFVGNLGTPTLVVTVLVGFLAPGPGTTTERTLVIVAGLLFILITLTNRPVQRALVRMGQTHARQRLLPHLDRNVVELVDLGDDFVVGSIRVAEDPEPTVRSLRALDEVLPSVRVLGIRHGGDYLGASPVDVPLHAGDEIIVHGRRSDVDQVASG